MKVTFLGTGTSQGVPVIACHCRVCRSLDFRDKRLRSSLHLQVDGMSLVIDTGPDFRQQMLRQRIDQLDAILYTHEHKDHTAGLDDVRAYNFRQKRDMPVYGRLQVLDQLRQEYAYAFSEKRYPGVPHITLNEIHNAPFFIKGTQIIPIEVQHYKLPVFGFRIGDFTYITDANLITEEELQKIRGSRYLVLNALQKDNHISHFSLDEAVALARELDAEQTYLTHISHRMGLHKEVNDSLPDNVQLAYDGLQFELC